MEPAEKRGVALTTHREGGPLAIAKKTDPLAVARQHYASPQFLSDFLVKLEQRVQNIRAASLRGRSLAEEVLAFMRELVRTEVGVLGLEEGLERLLGALWAGPVTRALLMDLYRRALMVLHPRTPQSEQERFRTELAAFDLNEIVAWYARRKTTLLLVGDEGGSDADFMTPPRITHDVTYCGARGCEVMSAIRLLGHEYEALWYKVILKQDGKVLDAKKAWTWWVDETDSFIAPLADQSRRFASIAPIHPASQRLVVDAVRVFIPYSALDIVPGRYRFDVEAGLFDHRGRHLLEASTEDVFHMPPPDREGASVPSPAALGLWPADAVSGDRMSNLRVAQVVRSDGTRESQYLRAQLDLELCAHAETPVRLECRLMTAEGDLIDGDTSVYTARDGTFLAEVELRPQRTLARYYDLEVLVPVMALALDPGEYNLYCEIAVVLADRKVLCGMVERVRVSMPSIETMVRRGETRAEAERNTDAGLTLVGVEIETAYSFDLKECVRVETFLSSQSWNESLYRVSVSLEPRGESGDADSEFARGPIVKSLCCGGEDGPSERSLVFAFDRGLLTPPGDRFLDVESHYRCRVRIFTLDDRCVLETVRSLSLPPLQDGLEVQESVPIPNGSVEIVDVVSRLPSIDQRVVFSIVMNVSNFHPDTAVYSLYYEVSGMAEVFAQQPKSSGEEPNSLGGQLRALDYSAELIPVEDCTGWFQKRVEIECERGAPAEQSPRGKILKIMLFSKTGRLLQVAYHRLKIDDVRLSEHAKFVVQ